MRVLILGASGMLGSAVLDVFSRDQTLETFGTLRGASSLRYFPQSLHSHLLTGVDILDADSLVRTLGKVRPDVVINCVGLIKQLADANDPLIAIPLNTLFPHKLSHLCALSETRLIHISTDCVFSGQKGMYRETDNSDCTDLYGKSKYLGEIHDLPHAITLRTSIIGHELNSKVSLIDWFLSQGDAATGYTKAIFSGLPTAELAFIIKDWVLPKPELSGLYHVAAAPISKFDLLKLTASVYGKKCDIAADESVVINRSLDASRFTAATGYKSPDWQALIEKMFAWRNYRNTQIAR
ncbi:dTDP-4-dehydrorhamnose reductase family protein [Pseudomonas plecoglossicida]|uniref:dTDP-4-dehydrorhamnose reductase family protein n=1 Tax=Pseudomonas plecoglossicida TaxID=70775 RepID=UPI003D22F1AA